MSPLDALWKNKHTSMLLSLFGHQSNKGVSAALRRNWLLVNPKMPSLDFPHRR